MWNVIGEDKDYILSSPFICIDLYTLYYIKYFVSKCWRPFSDMPDPKGQLKRKWRSHVCLSQFFWLPFSIYKNKILYFFYQSRSFSFLLVNISLAMSLQRCIFGSFKQYKLVEWQKYKYLSFVGNLFTFVTYIFL